MADNIVNKKDNLVSALKYAFLSLFTLRVFILTIVFSLIGVLVSYLFGGNIIIGIICGVLFSFILMIVLLYMGIGIVNKEYEEEQNSI